MVNGKKNVDEEIDTKVKTVQELSTRIDERVKTLIGSQDKIEIKIEKFLEKQIEMISKILLMEQRIKNIEDSINEIYEKISLFEIHMNEINHFKKNSNSMWEHLIKYGSDFILALCIGYIFFLLHWSK